MQLTLEQQQALNTITYNTYSIITGPAKSGKSEVLMRAVADAARPPNMIDRIVVVCSDLSSCIYLRDKFQSKYPGSINNAFFTARDLDVCFESIITTHTFVMIDDADLCEDIDYEKLVKTCYGIAMFGTVNQSQNHTFFAQVYNSLEQPWWVENLFKHEQLPPLNLQQGTSEVPSKVHDLEAQLKLIQQQLDILLS